MITEVLREKARQHGPLEHPNDETLLTCLERQMKVLPEMANKRQVYIRIAALALLGMENHSSDGLLGLKKVLDNYVRPSYLEVPEGHFLDLEHGCILINIKQKQKLVGLCHGVGPERRIYQLPMVEVEPGDVIQIRDHKVLKMSFAEVAQSTKSFITSP